MLLSIIRLLLSIRVSRLVLLRRLSTIAIINDIDYLLASPLPQALGPRRCEWVRSTVLRGNVFHGWRFERDSCVDASIGPLIPCRNALDRDVGHAPTIAIPLSIADRGCFFGRELEWTSGGDNLFHQTRSRRLAGASRFIKRGCSGDRV